MKKSVFIIFLITIFVVPFILFAKLPKGDMKIKKVGNKKSAVIYNHVKHAKIKNAKDCKGCHAAMKTKAAAHKMCITCHKTEKVGPRKCKECHK